MRKQKKETHRQMKCMNIEALPFHCTLIAFVSPFHLLFMPHTGIQQHNRNEHSNNIDIYGCK